MATVSAPATHLRQGATWQQAGEAVPVKRLFAPASGALLASTGSALIRSDDAGASWRTVPLPEGSPVFGFEVDPNDHRVAYAATSAGVHRTMDDGVSWSLILPSNMTTLRIAVSPANSDVVYVAQSSADGSFALLRTPDRGATWTTLQETKQTPCGWSVLVLQPHPSDPARIFRTQGCYAGRDLGDALEQSQDAGATFARMFSPQTAFPHAIVGGSGADPGRLYAAANRDHRAGGSLVAVSRDDGATWATNLDHKGGSVMAATPEPSTVIGGLAYDPAAPDRVFVALERMVVNLQTVEASGISATTDGGATWMPIGQQDLPHVTHLVLGIDGRNLFAATAAGVWRLSLS